MTIDDLIRAARLLRLLGVAEALRQSCGAALFPYQLEDSERGLELLRTQLDKTTLTTYWAEDREMDMKPAVEYALVVIRNRV